MDLAAIHTYFWRTTFLVTDHVMTTFGPDDASPKKGN